MRDPDDGDRNGDEEEDVPSMTPTQAAATVLIPAQIAAKNAFGGNANTAGGDDWSLMREALHALRRFIGEYLAGTDPTAEKGQ